MRVFRTSDFGIDAVDKKIKTQTDQEHHSREYGGWKRTVMIAGKKRFQSSAQQPDLDNQENGDERHRSSNSRQATVLRRQVV